MLGGLKVPFSIYFGILQTYSVTYITKKEEKTLPDFLSLADRVTSVKFQKRLSLG